MYNLQIAIAMRAERSLAFATRVTVFACASKDTAALDATSAFPDITDIPIADRATAAPSARPPSVAIPRASARASPISPGGLAINAVQDITNTRSASVRESRRNSLRYIQRNISIEFLYSILLSL